ncbi:tRNA (guanine(37)-N1)-methyltransferase-like isoform X2 [Panonychus citri]|nr:tRNA (guanine(37)-N1)-methyltransferase-like isoform X2 [Panonychus citri]XP_053205884.1 tRNA (guanine(37)-N1)-methyltransferase-like isoform X2 [Panonychus citri]XP_053205885.1 tRNA (guanine(37)-N1)-methyltransferase-like isoform X2 [Panonychus citri]
MSPTLASVDSILKPPSCVANLTKLDHTLFRKTIKVPYIVVEDKFIQNIAKHLKSQYLTVKGIDTIQCFQSNDSSTDHKITHDGDGEKTDRHSSNKMILLNPDLVKSVDNLDERVVKMLTEKYKEIVLHWKEIELNFGNYNVHDIIDAIFPDEEKRVKSWSIIGHILHVNLRDEKLQYKDLIGQVLLETNPTVSLIINKAEIIDTKFRNFSHEILAQKPDSDKLGTQVTVHSNNCTFKFDFAKVYWNPRLNTEHTRFLNRLDKCRDVVYDLFAGIGPFAIPAAKRNCRVLANDLNPDAFHWLKVNSKLNKVDSKLTAHNMDARQFVRTVVRDDLLSSWASPEVTEFVIKPTYHVLMNLPGMAVEFLDSFVGLLADKVDDSSLQPLVIPPMVHCYTFLKRDRSPIDSIPLLVEETIKSKLPGDYELKKVRAVAPFKDMFRITFKLPIDVLFDTRTVKRQKISN